MLWPCTSKNDARNTPYRFLHGKIWLSAVSVDKLLRQHSGLGQTLEIERSHPSVPHNVGTQNRDNCSLFGHSQLYGHPTAYRAEIAQKARVPDCWNYQIRKVSYGYAGLKIFQTPKPCDY